MIVVHPNGGLCNYLRVIFSYLSLAISRNETLLVEWEVTSSCNGWFLDYFDPIEGVQFVQSISSTHQNIDYRGCSICPDFAPDYSRLHVSSSTRKLISERQSYLGAEYTAVHVRRTDHVKLAKKHGHFTDDNTFFEFVKSQEIQRNLYIATDNKHTYNKFKRRFPELVQLEYPTYNKKAHRQTSLQDAIIDLYICIEAQNFLGSGYSSFSDFIMEIREKNK